MNPRLFGSIVLVGAALGGCAERAIPIPEREVPPDLGQLDLAALDEARLDCCSFEDLAGADLAGCIPVQCILIL